MGEQRFGGSHASRLLTVLCLIMIIFAQALVIPVFSTAVQSQSVSQIQPAHPMDALMLSETEKVLLA